MGLLKVGSVCVERQCMCVCVWCTGGAKKMVEGSNDGSEECRGDGRGRAIKEQTNIQTLPVKI